MKPLPVSRILATPLIRWLGLLVLSIVGAERRFRVRPGALPNPVLYSTRFENAELPEFAGNRGALELIAAPLRTFETAARVSLNWNGARSVRSEIVPIGITTFLEGRFPRLGQPYRYSFWVYLPQRYESDAVTETFAQWHDIPDEVFGEADRNPPLMLACKSGQYICILRSDPRLIVPPGGIRYDGGDHATLGPIAADIGKWTQWVVEVCWCYRQDRGGFTRIWKDGALCFEREGPNCYNDLRGGPYLKLGMYKPGWKRTPPDTHSAAQKNIVLGPIEIRRLREPLRSITPR